MRLVALFMALYLSILACVPCSDGEHNHAEQQDPGVAAYAYSNAPLNSHPHQQCNDTCSPFCGCHCCSVNFTLRAPAVFSAVPRKAEFSNQRFPDLEARTKDVSIAIDHPPQLV